MNAFDILIQQLDQFIKKYYKHLMFKGLFFFAFLFLLSFLITSGLEYYGRLNSFLRAFLFYSFLLGNGYLFIQYVCIPVLKLYRIGKCINREQAASIIGNFFPSISDQLLNTLQLENQLEKAEDISLLQEAILQKSAKLSVFDFSQAIDRRKEKKWLVYLVPMFFTVLTIGIFEPTFFQESFHRVVHYDTFFKPKAPFSFQLLTTDLKVEEGNNYHCEVVLEGRNLPEEVFIHTQSGKYKMVQRGKNRYAFDLIHPLASSSFFFSGNDFESDVYFLDVYGRSFIGQLKATLIYPAYLEKKNEVLTNSNFLVVPEGTTIQWDGLLQHTDDLLINRIKHQSNSTEKQFRYRSTFYQSDSVVFSMKNHKMKQFFHQKTSIDVVKDAFPFIEVAELADSSGQKYIKRFEGNVRDDIGLKDLVFHYDILRPNKTIKKAVNLPVDQLKGVDESFVFGVDFLREELSLNEEIVYYFIVRDNDAIHGFKRTESSHFTFQVPSKDELNEQRDSVFTDSKNDLKDLLKRNEALNKKLKSLKNNSTSKSSSWNKASKVKDLQQEQENLVKDLQSLKESLNQNNAMKNALDPLSPELLEKQKLIDEMLSDLLDPEMMKLLKELEDLLKKNNPDAVNEQLDKLNSSAEEQEKEMDRTLEMLKKMQLNEKLDNLEKQLKELSKEQNDLKNNDKLDDQKKLDEQQKINEQFSAIKEEIKEMHEENESLKNPMELSKTDEQEERIQQDLNDAKEGLEKNKSNSSKKAQEKAADEMNQLAEQLNDMQEKSNEKDEGEDMESLRSLLENLMTLSFTQESLLHRFMKTDSNDPSYRSLGKKQRKIIDDTKLVEDSLNALAMRQPKIAKMVQDELKSIKENLGYTINLIDEQKTRELVIKQQQIMTNYNNLALLLNESLQQMQQQMQQKKDGSGTCSKPGGKGGKKPGAMKPGDMKEMLKKQLDAMKKGPNPGGKKPGSNQGQGMMGLNNEQIAKMAAEQSAIRRKLEELRNELNKAGKGEGNQLTPVINELEKQQQDIIRNRFTPEVIKRQQEILTRLLESEKAINERGLEEKRESNSGKNEKIGNLIILNEYNKKKLAQLELIQIVDPALFKYYRDKSTIYFNSLY